MITTLLTILLIAGEWTAPVEVRSQEDLCLTYKARLDGPFLVVQATIEPGWHTFAMDNKTRAEEKLAGKRSLGLDHPTEVVLSAGLNAAGPWYQSPPKDFSKPEIRYFSWGFDQRQALFVTKVSRSGAGPARIAIRGQACTASVCKNIDVAISVPLGSTNAGSEIDLKNLVQVR